MLPSLGRGITMETPLRDKKAKSSLDMRTVLYMATPKHVLIATLSHCSILARPDAVFTLVRHSCGTRQTLRVFISVGYILDCSRTFCSFLRILRIQLCLRRLPRLTRI